MQNEMTSNDDEEEIEAGIQSEFSEDESNAHFGELENIGGNKAYYMMTPVHSTARWAEKSPRQIVRLNNPQPGRWLASP